MTENRVPVVSTVSRRQMLQGMSVAAAAAFFRTELHAAFDDANSARNSFSNVLAFVDEEFQARTFPGAALAVTRHGKPVLEKYWGTYCSREQRAVPCDGAMVNMLYSVSKLVSSTVIVMAQQDGRFDYDAPVSRYIPNFTGGGKEKITVRHLLTHSAGLPGVPIKAVEPQEKWDEALAILCAARVEWEPGSKTAYHGLTGHFLAAEVVRRCSDMKPWETICQELLFKPIGATSITYKMPGQQIPVAITPQPPEGPYNQAGFNDAIAGHPAGSAFGTNADLLKVLQLHLNRGVWEGKTLIKPEALKEMHTVQYAAQIEAATKAGTPRTHDNWGLGILLRGPGPVQPAHGWFGMAEVQTAGVFGHAGIDTIIAVADPELDAALVFLTTDSPKPMSKVSPLRSGVTAKAFAGLG